MSDRQTAVLRIWFGDGETDLERLNKQSTWWNKDVAFDRLLRDRFEQDLQRAKRGEYDGWKQTALGSLAWIILTDQFSRNVYRGTAAAFAQDALALDAAISGMEKGQDIELSAVQRVFFYMPLMHSEQWSMQERSLACFGELARTAPPETRSVLESNYDFAQRHAAIIHRFGRYPHRNAILGRQSSEEELAFLEQPNSSF